MTSPKTRPILRQLGHDLRSARLRRRLAVADLALRSGSSPSTITRLEKGEPGIGIGTLADVLIVLGLADRLAELIDVRSDELGLALTDQSLPQRGRNSPAARRKRGGEDAARDDASDDDGVAF
ncbi:helix-turn-helix transcriptional regulator [Sphingomonas sp. G-3-2-10]|uniref:helix-turn-helix domain-containing protein n=1 Tax=Sphingomonas sp. G-3-2-10 TaxID=2728838 RepID=UPI00146ED59E|nr:helix-turn-helix transcriptional regulator [Sphingomonas sp. G-3-2-10]NML08027.1 helix-turn-helix transcriptional regulator [Sphingomonas sp. G-3-2-10]